jgi:DNA-binding MarR family transcriptional regulator
MDPKIQHRPSRVTGCTCMRLRKATRRVSQIYDRHLEPSGLTITQYGLLAYLMAVTETTIGALAEKLAMDPTTLTRNLRPLIRQGLVVLQPDRRDRRVRCVSLTDKGREVFMGAKPLWRAAQNQINATIGDIETSSLHAQLDHALERLAE